MELDLTGVEFILLSTHAAESARLVLRKNWRLKAVLMALASRVPGGVFAYRFVQDRQAQHMNDADGLLARSVDLLALYSDGGGEIRGKDCLEIGTGWCPWLPLLLKVKGARRVVTLDLNPWLSIRTASGTTRALAERIDGVAGRLEVPRADIEKVLGPALSAKTLPEWLAAVGVEYLPKTELQRAAFAAESFDVVFSSNVLEHVDANSLGTLHRESARILRPGGMVAHRFNPQDHFSFDDPNITGANFLKYSPAAWKWIGGSGLAYHNRLRCPQHRHLIDGAGFSIELQRTRPDRKAQQAIDSGRLLVHSDFRGMSSAELTDDYMWVVARKP